MVTPIEPKGFRFPILNNYKLSSKLHSPAQNPPLVPIFSLSI
jgi:hypothetical protein